MAGELPRRTAQRKRIFLYSSTGTVHVCSSFIVIGRLTGKVALEEPDGRLLVDVGGVGYEVSTPVGTVGRATSGAEPGSFVLFVHTHVREDSFELFGFATEMDRQLFRMLLGVQKVGPKLALGLLSALSAEDLGRALGEGDVSWLCRVPGVGRKTAERLVLELREKARQAVSATARTPTRPGNVAERVAQALVGMGYKAPEAERAVKGLGEAMDALPVSEALRLALGSLTQRRG
jgi:Holliday junction DNA helicase RuvA